METTTGRSDLFKEDVERAIKLAQVRVGRFEVRPKRESTFMWLLYAVSFMWIWNRRFMTHFVTTIGGVMYCPWELGTKGVLDLAMVKHEAKHAQDSKDGGIMWSVSYLYPQVLALGALGALGAFWNQWALLSLVCLLAALPWPSPPRVRAELRGYDETFKVMFRHGFSDERAAKEWMLRVFCGWEYWRMSRRWQPIHDHFTELFARLRQ